MKTISFCTGQYEKKNHPEFLQSKRNEIVIFLPFFSWNISYLLGTNRENSKHISQTQRNTDLLLKWADDNAHKNSILLNYPLIIDQPKFKLKIPTQGFITQVILYKCALLTYLCLRAPEIFPQSPCTILHLFS